MSTFAQKQNQLQKPVYSSPTRSKMATRGPDYREHPILHLQRTLGNHAVQRLLQAHAQEPEDESRTSVLPRFADHFSRIPVHADAQTTIQQSPQANTPRVEPGRLACAAMPAGTATAMEQQGKTGSEEFEAEPMMIQPEGPDQTPAPINEDGLIDGEWTSEVAAHAFVNGGKTGTAIVNWVGGAGGTTPGIGDVTTVAPVIETGGPAAAGGIARAWVRAGTGKATVSRTYTGVLVGANGANYYITTRAAARIDRHEENHITHSKTHHDAFITPLETRVAQRTGEAKAMNQGADVAAAKTALETFLDWNASITKFRDADLADNAPGGAVDTADAASAGFYSDYGPRTVGGVNYAHYVDTPPGP